DVALFSAMLNHILARGLEAKRFIADRTKDFTKLRQSVQALTPEVAAKITGVPADLIARAAEIYAKGPNTSTLWAMGLTQHANGTDLVASLLNLMLACGMIGRWGAAMMPVRGQNNVQGASDVGAIPFVYTDYRSVKDPTIRAEYAEVWGVPAEALARQAASPPGDARHDLQILIELSHRLGLETPHTTPQHVMGEIVRVTPSWAGVTYERLEGAGLQYPVPTPDHRGTAFLFDQRFPT